MPLQSQRLRSCSRRRGALGRTTSFEFRILRMEMRQVGLNNGLGESTVTTLIFSDKLLEDLGT